MKAEYKLSLYVFCFLLLGIGTFVTPTSAYEVTVKLEDINSADTEPPGSFRWLDVANQPFRQFIRENYDYTQADVTVTYEDVAGTFQGTLTAFNLKPNFAYQLKLAGNPDIDADSNERIGLAGRWWQEYNGTGRNLNSKGDGSSPNPNDDIYFDTWDNPDYRYTGYLVFDYFITDEYGNANFSFEANSSYHVLWATNDSDGNDGVGHRDREIVNDVILDGPLKDSTFDADLSLAYVDTGFDFALWDTQQSSVWVWDQVRNRGGPDPVIYYLEAGEHTLTIKQREDGTKIDKILITNDMGYVPQGLGDGDPSEIWLEAEDGYLQTPMELVSDVDASSGMSIWVPNGQGNVLNPSQDAGYAEYIFEVPASGNFVIWGRVLAVTGVDDSFFISMDGGDFPYQTVNIFGEWERLPVGEVYLQPGDYSAQIILTEESFHGSGGQYAGGWAAAMGNDIEFNIRSTPSTFIWFEAEDGYLQTPMELVSDVDASSGMSIWVPNGQGNVLNPSQDAGYAEYIFEVPASGNFVIWGRVLAVTGVDDSFFISMDGGDFSLWDTQQAGSYIWDKVNNRGGSDPVVYYLAAGAHTLTIKQREDGTIIDRILITNDMNYVPQGLGDGDPSEIWLEAEDGYLQTPMELVSDVDASSGMSIWVPNGQGNVLNPSQDAGYAEYIFEVPASGNFVIWGRVLAVTGVDDSFFISMDGGDFSLWDTQQAGSYIWDKVNNRGGSDPVVYYLAAGAHTLTIKQREDGTIIDRILITNDMNYVPLE